MILLFTGTILISISLLLTLTKFLISYKNKNYPKNYNSNSFNICILIPARNESKVINNLLESINNQSEKINMKNVYIIIEDLADPTLKIAKNYGATIIMRRKIHLKRKGYALMEAIEYLKEMKKSYDAYFIFDADNILDKNYFKEMKKTYQNNYDIGIGYRNISNANDNSISASSSFIFSIINTLKNKKNTKKTINCTISGTGFYIRGSFIDEWKTYPFHSLTEDYELTLHSIINNMTTYYNKDAIYYDEQPTTYKQYITQRTRWIKGYFESRKKYKKLLLKKFKRTNPNIASVFNEIIGVYDIIMFLIGILFIIFSFMLNHLKKPLQLTLGITLIILIIYILLIIFTTYIIIKEQKNYKLNKHIIIKSIFIHPILLASYIPCAIKALFKKNLEWKTIEHKGFSHK